MVGCPQKFVGGEIIDFLEYADHAKRGCYPVAGGSLDQTHWFLAASNFLANEERRVENESWKK